MSVGVDVGGTKTLAVATDDDGTVLERAELPTRMGDRGVVGTIVDAVGLLASRHPESRGAPVGVGIPGIVADGVVRRAANLEIVELDLARELAATLRVPVQVENDTNVAALGVLESLVPRPSSLAFLNVGTGLACGIVLDGRLLRGASGAAGEIGHVVASGQRSAVAAPILEHYASGSGIAASWPSAASPTADALVTAAAGGDVDAARVLDGVVHGIAQSVQLLVLTLDVETVVLGGGVVRALGGGLVGRLAEAFRGWQAPVFDDRLLAGRLRLAAPGVPFGALGAASLWDGVPTSPRELSPRAR